MRISPFLFFCLMFVFPTLSFSQLSEPEIIFDGATTPIAFTFLNLNNDELEDFVVARKGTKGDSLVGGLYAYTKLAEEGGPTEFTSEKISDQLFSNIWAIDLDHDGDKDLLCRTFNQMGQGICYTRAINDNEVFIFDDNTPPILNDSCVFILEIIDVNLDGLDDFLYLKQGPLATHVTFIAIAKSDGTFEHLEIGAKEGDILYDFINQDSILDFIVEDKDLDFLYVMLSNVSMEYQIHVIDSSFSFRKSIIEIGDLTNDGTKEILLMDSDADELYYLDELETDQDPVKKLIASQDFGGAYVLDFNFDNALDIYVNNGIAFGLHLNDGFGNFTSTGQAIDLPVGEILYSKIDNANKKATYYFTDARMYRFDIDDEKYSKRLPSFPDLEIRSLDDVEMFDINQDGFMDLFFASRWGGAVAYLEGVQGKNFGKMNPVAFDEEGALDIDLEDFDQDGNMDIAYSSIWTGNLAVKYGDGVGSFGGKQYLKEDWGLVRGSTAGDFEGDGYPDVIVSTISTNETIYYSNHEGVFEEPILLNSGIAYDPFLTRDIDFDGDLDAIGIQYSGTSTFLDVYKNDGTGNFVRETENLGSNSWNFYFLDFDGDGRDEFVGASQTQVSVSRFNGTKYAPWITVAIPDMNNSFPFVVLDYNGDGLLDLIIEDFNPIEHRLYKNVNNEAFVFDDLASEKLSIKLPSFRSSDEHVLDLDNDGDYDLVYDQDDYRIYRISDLRGDRSITGNVFWDINQDSTLDASENGIRDVRIDVTDPDGNMSSTFTNAKGQYEIFVDTGAHQIQTIALNDCWKPNFEQPIELEVGNAGLQNINFPFISKGGETSVGASLSRAPTRCGFTIRYFATIYNEGCNTIFGRATYDLDPLIAQFTEISLDAFTIEGNQVQIPFGTLLPGESMRFNMLVTVPGVEYLGTYLKDEINIHYDLIDGSIEDQHYAKQFSSEIRCAVDPNDKIASPDRRDQFEKAYIIDEPIFYTLRFQNTGNDTAFNIRLTDTLSELLDISTFKPIDASHNYRTVLKANERSLEVFFNNILLPDSTTNQIESNGFFTFSIEPIRELPDFTPIYNSAAIYFDFNPPIFTNEMQLDYVSDLSLISTSLHPTIKNMSVVFPNPNTGLFRISDERALQNIQIFDANGVSHPLKRNRKIVDAQDLPPGVYTVMLQLGNEKVVDRIVIVR